LDNTLFEQIWIEHNRVVGVKAREQLKPFFQLSYEEWLKKFESENSNPPGVATENINT